MKKINCWQGKIKEPRALDGSSCSQNSLSENLDIVIKMFPNRTALSDEESSWTYSELDGAVAVLAARLISRGIRKGDVVGILMPRSTKVILSLLAVLRIGASYVPIDLSYPKERIGFILGDTNARALILCPSLSVLAEELDISVLSKEFLELETESVARLGSLTTNPAKVVGSDIAYVLYTSGSTGKPKGVQVTHSNLQNYVYWVLSEYGMDELDIADFSTSLAFDASVGSTIVPLLCGAQIKICPENVKALPNKYMLHLAANKITLVKPTPSYFNQLVKMVRTEKYQLSLKTIILGGEALVPSDVKEWLSVFPKQTIINEYGPTEATVGTLSYQIRFGNPYLETDRLPIGYPAYNTKLYIVDSQGKNCARGQQGELLIAGKSVSAGYLNRSELNKASFLDDFERCERLYKTGDLVRENPDGTIAYLGRLDRQIKIRGYRIEPSEIEKALLNHKAIETAIIEPIEKAQEKKLAVYLRLSEHKIANTFEIRQYLNKILPEYMIPSYFIFLDKIPLTVNGKLNRSALPFPGQQRDGQLFIKPENEIEQSVLKVWTSVLNLNSGVTDDFFLLGGESINAAQIIYEIEKEFSIQVSLHDFYQQSTVRKLAKLIEDKLLQAVVSDQSLLDALAEIESSPSEIKE